MKLFYKAAGFVSLGLGTLGIFLPLMPTTCFVLLSAWCFAKSSPQLHARLASNKLFGTIIRQWECQRCIPEKAKYIAIGSMLIAGSYAFFAVDDLVFRLIVVITIATSIFIVKSIQSCKVVNKAIAARCENKGKNSCKNKGGIGKFSGVKRSLARQ
ncbi:MAG: YbaN family protein [Amphritea sp.]